MLPLARIFLALGVICLVISGLLYLAARFGLPLGRLPGDIRIERGNLTVFLPLATCVVLSIILTIVLNVFVRLLKK